MSAPVSTCRVFVLVLKLLGQLLENIFLLGSLARLCPLALGCAHRTATRNDPKLDIDCSNQGILCISLSAVDGPPKNICVVQIRPRLQRSDFHQLREIRGRH